MVICHAACKMPQSSRQITSHCSLNITKLCNLALYYVLYLFPLLFRRAGIASGLLSPLPPASRPPPKGCSPFSAPVMRLLPCSNASHWQSAHIKTLILCLHRRREVLAPLTSRLRPPLRTIAPWGFSGKTDKINRRD